MLAFLGRGARLDESHGTTESVGCCGIIAMVGGLPIAGKEHVFWVLEVTMHPAILRAIQAEVETSGP